MTHIVITFSVVGQFSEWPYFHKYCAKSFSDLTGISVGIISKSIKTDFGTFPVKFVLLFLGKSIQHYLKPTHRYTEEEILEQGLDTILDKLGRKIIIKIQ